MKKWNTFSVGRMNRLVHDTIVEPQGRDAGRHSQAQRIIHSKEIGMKFVRWMLVMMMNHIGMIAVQSNRQVVVKIQRQVRFSNSAC